jgi:hypothetical protein
VAIKNGMLPSSLIVLKGHGRLISFHSNKLLFVLTLQTHKLFVETHNVGDYTILSEC